MALVTGTSRGIGEQVVRQLVRGGYVVFGTSGTAMHHPDFQMMALDVTDQMSISIGIKTILDKTGRIDVLINNAGIIGTLGAAEEVSIAQAQEIFDTNFWGTVRVTNAVLPTMRAQKRGTIYIKFSALFCLLHGKQTRARRIHCEPADGTQTIWHQRVDS